VLTTDQKGAIAETAVIHEAIKLGIGVLKPVNDGLRYDLVLDIDEQLVRVQVKWVRRHGDVLTVRCYSSRRSADGFVRRRYTPAEVDRDRRVLPRAPSVLLAPTGRVRRSDSYS